ncbi:MAG: hypothetical protein LBN95_08605 [Prevotellaceae bacterium]|jgi:hypothetical protein|nr:hypothetical protein [Prevotellaceae bacterium]
MQEDLLEFDDSDAIEFIKKSLSDGGNAAIDEDDIQYVLDLIIDYYEENNLIEEDEAQEAEIAEDDMFEYISAKMKQEKVVDLTDEQLQLILDGEFAYGVSIGIYE